MFENLINKKGYENIDNWVYETCESSPIDK